MLSVIFLTSLTPFFIDRPFMPQNSCLDCVLCASTQNRQPAISYFFHVGLVSELPLALLYVEGPEFKYNMKHFS